MFLQAREAVGKGLQGPEGTPPSWSFNTQSGMYPQLGTGEDGLGAGESHSGGRKDHTVPVIVLGGRQSS